MAEKDSTNKLSKKEMEKKRKDDIEREAEIRAKEKEYILKLKKAAEEKAKKDSKNKPKFSKNSYFFSFKYQIEEHAGNKIFQFTDFDGKKNKEYEIINKKDKVIYLNDDHPNHMKKGVVTKINIIGSYVKFTIVFDDPPFVWEYNNRTGEKVKTNKKIKVIELVDFDNIKKIWNKLNLNSDNKITLTKISNNTVNIRDFLNEPWINRSYNLQQNNIILILYQLILFILDLKISENQLSDREKRGEQQNWPIIKELGEIKKKDNDEKTNKILKKNFVKKDYIKSVIFNENLNIFKKDMNKLVYDFILFFNLEKKTSELLFKDNEKQINLEKTNISDSDKNKLINSKYITADKKIIRGIDKLKANAIKYFDHLFKSILPSKDNLGSFENFGIDNDLDKISFVKNIQNKKDEIIEKDIMTNQKRIEFKLKERIRDVFYTKRKMFPDVVKFKYSGKTNEQENTLITDPDKLVSPSESKIFTLKEVEPVKQTQENDYILNENGEKQLEQKIFKITKSATESSPGEIEVLLKIALNVETEKTPEEILEESKKSPTMRLIQSFISNIKNKLNCTKSKLDFYENLEQIAKMIEPVKEFSIDEDDDNEPT